jgi:Domain of unknown function (DUF397)
MDHPDDLTWRTSSYSGSNGGNCIEIAATAARTIAVRDSKNPAGPLLAFTAATWTAFTRELKTSS